MPGGGFTRHGVGTTGSGMDKRRRILAGPDSKPVSFGRFDAAFVDELAWYFGRMRVLEIFAGNGLLCSMLSKRGVDVLPTTRFSSHDGNELGIHADVVEADVPDGVKNLFDLPILRRDMALEITDRRPELVPLLMQSGWWKETFVLRDELLAWREGGGASRAPGP